MKKIFALLTLLLLTAACSPATSQSSSPAADPTTPEQKTILKVGASPAPHAEILEFVKDSLADQNISLQIVEFTDYVLPNSAVFDGSLDANYFQHQPYLTTFNQKNYTDLVSVGAIHFEPLGVYPGKTASLEALSSGAVIAIPNDPTNEARALSLLAANGLITLRKGTDLSATPLDIVDNPNKLVFRELEAAQLPNVLQDVDLAVINGNYAVNANIIDSVLVTEDPNSPAAQAFANIVAVRPQNTQDPAVLALVEALTSQATKDFIAQKYGASILPVS